jgi:hypothetical protein
MLADATPLLWMTLVDVLAVVLVIILVSRQDG